MICCGPLKMHLLVLRPLSVGLELRYISSVQQTALQRPGNGLPQKLLCLGVLGEGAQWGKSDNGRVRARERSIHGCSGCNSLHGIVLSGARGQALHPA